MHAIDVVSLNGWEAVGRLAVMFGAAGLLGVVGRLVAVWLRKRYHNAAPK